MGKFNARKKDVGTVYKFHQKNMFSTKEVFYIVLSDPFISYHSEVPMSLTLGIDGSSSVIDIHTDTIGDSADEIF